MATYVSSILHPSYCIRSGFLIVSTGLLLSACASQPAPPPIVQARTVEIKVPAYVPLGAALTAAVPMPQPTPHMTNGDLHDLAVRRGDALKRANRQLDEIRELQPHD